jgi:hypothetical protein
LGGGGAVGGGGGSHVAVRGTRAWRPIGHGSTTHVSEPVRRRVSCS